MIYYSCDLEINSLFDSDEFYLSQNKPSIINQIKKIIDIEAPISHELLSRKILNAWGITRLGVRLNDYLSRIYNQIGLKKTRQHNTYFYWKVEQDPEKYDQFRVPEVNNQKRDVGDIAKEEIANGVKEILINQISLPKDDLIKEVAKLFGYSRIVGDVEEMMKLGIDYARKKQFIVNQNGKFIITDN